MKTHDVLVDDLALLDEGHRRRVRDVPLREQERGTQVSSRRRRERQRNGPWSWQVDEGCRREDLGSEEEESEVSVSSEKRSEESRTNLSKVVSESLKVLIDHASSPGLEPPRESDDQAVQESESLGDLECESSGEVDRTSLLEDEVDQNLDSSRVGLVEVVAAANRKER